jgi:hypothetical protein
MKMSCGGSHGSTTAGVGKPHPSKRWHSGGTFGKWRYVNWKMINPEKNKTCYVAITTLFSIMLGPKKIRNLIGRSHVVGVTGVRQRE